MSFGVDLNDEVIEMIARWQLPGIVQIEILERLYEELAPTLQSISGECLRPPTTWSIASA
jgi:hypothetical protein